LPTRQIRKKEPTEAKGVLKKSEGASVRGKGWNNEGDYWSVIKGKRKNTKQTGEKKVKNSDGEKKLFLQKTQNENHLNGGRKNWWEKEGRHGEVENGCQQKEGQEVEEQMTGAGFELKLWRIRRRGKKPHSGVWVLCRNTKHYPGSMEPDF